ncbi:MAG TPA: hypothetical protein VFO65_14800 [Acidimicrobiales bacterium]|nr:hypothetical protein [Acidimicrobiales bacterium]
MLLMLSHPYLTEVLVSDRHHALLAAAPTRRRNGSTAAAPDPAPAARGAQMAGFRAALGLALGRRAVRSVLSGARPLPGRSAGPSPAPCPAC